MTETPLMTTVLDEVRSAVLTVPNVQDAAAVHGRDPVPRHGLHLSDLVPAALSQEPKDAAVVLSDPEAPASPATRSAEPSILDGGPVDLPDGYPRTLQDALARAARQAPEKGITFLLPDGIAEHLTYPRLLGEAESVLAGLRALDMRPGDSVLFQFDANRAFIIAFWACVLGGFLPAPLAVSADVEQGAGKLHDTWRLLGQPLILTDLDADELTAAFSQRWNQPLRVAAFDDVRADHRDQRWFPARPDSPVLNLLTSGSTGTPKCVRHNNRSIVARTWADTVVNRLTADEVTLNSMAMDHVMGLVMSHTRDVFLCCAQVNVKTDLLITRPLNWLDWTDRYGITNLSAPNFAFALLNKHAAEIEAGRWDLSSLRTIYNAGEPVVSRTAHDFLKLLARYDLPPDAMVPAWGMSETASAVTHSRLTRDDESLNVVVVDQDSMTADLCPAGPGTAKTVTFTAVGTPIPGISLRLVDADGKAVPRGRVGRLEVTGETMMTGYFNNYEANADAYTADGWFKTGDLAFLWDGNVVIAGRERDLIIVNGANYYCHEIEAVAGAVPGVESTGAAACGLFSVEAGTDQLLIFFVPEGGPTPQGDLQRQADLARTIRATVARQVGPTPAFVVPLSGAEFPRTDSGKIQRGRLLTAFTDGLFDDRLRQLEVVDEGSTALPAWFFSPAWESSPLPERAATRAGRVVVLFADGRDEEVANRLSAAHTLIVVRSTAGPSTFDADGYQLNPEDEDGYRRLFEEIARDHRDLLGIVHAWTLTRNDPKDVAGGLRRGVLSVVRLSSALAVSRWPTAGLVVMTRLSEGSPPAHGPLVGLLKTLANERTAGTTRLIDVPDGSVDEYPDLLTELDSTEDVLVRYSGGRRLASRLQPVLIPPDLDPGTALPAGGLYVITGGLGGIGREVARYLVTAGDAKVLLLGRKDATAADMDGLRSNGTDAEVRYECVDITDEAALSAAVERAERSWQRPLTGVLHLAGRSVRDRWDDLDAHVVAHEPISEFESMFEAKIAGTVAVARLLDDRPEAWVLLFSSVNGYFGGSGFGAYAAACGFQDAFAAYWSCTRGRDVQSLAWSQWNGIGMNPGGPATTAAAARGFRPISAAQGLGSLVVARATGARHLLIGLDPGNLGIRPLLSEAATRPSVIVGYVGGTDQAEQIRQAAARALGGNVPVHVAAVPEIPRTPDGEVDATVLAWLAAGNGQRSHSAPPRAGLEAEVAEIMCTVLGRDFIGRDESFFEIGGTSMASVRMQGEIGRRLNRKLALRTLFQRPTVSEIAAALGGQPT